MNCFVIYYKRPVDEEPFRYFVVTENQDETEESLRQKFIELYNPERHDNDFEQFLLDLDSTHKDLYIVETEFEITINTEEFEKEWEEWKKPKGTKAKKAKVKIVTSDTQENVIAKETTE